MDETGWALADKNKKKANLNDSISAGEVMKYTLSGKDMQLSNKGGIITLLDSKGLKVNGVSYTKNEASRQGWTIIFK
jgi:hypothetical protein